MDVNFVTAIRPATDKQATLILMHGLGSDEQDMLGLAQALDPRVEVICVRAPISYGPGYAWFDIQWTIQGIQIDEDQYWQSVDQVVTWIESLNEEKLMVGGFSQGAMMALGTLYRKPGLATAAVLLSGRGLNREAPSFNGSIFQAHGAYDDVIPIQEARTLNASLASLGERYEYHEYTIGHWINEEELDDLNTWLSAVLA